MSEYEKDTFTELAARIEYEGSSLAGNKEKFIEVLTSTVKGALLTHVYPSHLVSVLTPSLDYRAVAVVRSIVGSVRTTILINEHSQI